jgi:hypothetical protein
MESFSSYYSYLECNKNNDDGGKEVVETWLLATAVPICRMGDISSVWMRKIALYSYVCAYKLHHKVTFSHNFPKLEHYCSMHENK